MTSIAETVRVCAAGIAIGVCVLLTGCESSVAGSAVRAPRSGPDAADVPLIKESAMDGFLLSIGELKKIVGSTKMAVTGTLDQMGDHSGNVSDKKCLGSMYGAENQVYSGSGFKAVIDKIASEPDQHFVEQITVLFPSVEKAQDFLDKAQKAWDSCAHTTVETEEGDSAYGWDVGAVATNDTLITQTITQKGAGGWACQHGLGVVSNLVVETFACGNDISNEGETVAKGIIAKATKK